MDQSRKSEWENIYQKKIASTTTFLRYKPLPSITKKENFEESDKGMIHDKHYQWKNSEYPDKLQSSRTTNEESSSNNTFISLNCSCNTLHDESPRDDYERSSSQVYKLNSENINYHGNEMSNSLHYDQSNLSRSSSPWKPKGTTSLLIRNHKCVRQLPPLIRRNKLSPSSPLPSRPVHPSPCETSASWGIEDDVPQ